MPLVQKRFPIVYDAHRNGLQKKKAHIFQVKIFLFGIAFIQAA